MDGGTPPPYNGRGSPPPFGSLFRNSIHCLTKEWGERWYCNKKGGEDQLIHRKMERGGDDIPICEFLGVEV